jgi:diadenylate cyclase
MRDFLERHVLHNLGLKLISLALAAGLWLAVSRDPVAEMAVDVPIEFHNIPDKLDIVSENIPQAEIRVRGPERIIHRMRASDIHTAVDLANIRPGQRTFELTAGQVQAPVGLQVVQVIPSQLHLSFDTHVSREVDVHPRIVGTFAQGYRIGRVDVDPPKVTISGPRTRVEAVQAAVTDVFDAAGNLDRVTFFRHAYVSDPLVQVANPDPVKVTVIMEHTPGDAAR